ncbi:MAG: TonB-dependent receptor [Ignavibacteria bacterium]
MKVMYSLVLVILFFLTNSIYAQNGKISGSVVDKSTNTPIEAVSVALLKGSDSTVVTGTETDAQGKFALSQLPFGTYNLRVTIVGYSKAVLKGIVINTDKPEAILEPISLKSGETETEEIVVEGERSAIEFKGEKKIFNVEKGMNVQGGSAVDVLKNIPSVAVDADGNISLRGNQNVKILVDGKPFGLSNSENRNSVLDQIPANMIESIELVTNPSAKYEAESSAGIINIKLKKKEGLGYNGTMVLNAGSRDKYNGSLNLNFRKDKFNFFGNYDYRLYNYIIEGENSRDNFSINSDFSQTTSGTSRNISHFLKGGFDYNINDNNSLSYLINYNPRERKRIDNSDATTIGLQTQDLISHYNFITDDLVKGHTLDMSLNFFKKFKNPQQTLSTEAVFTSYTDETNTNTTQSYIFPSGVQPALQNRLTDDKTNEGILTLDYAHPFSKESKLETGFKINLRDNNKNYDVGNFDYNTNSYTNDTTQSNDYSYNENIYGAYATFSSTINKFGYQLGLRAEQTDTKGDLRTTNQINEKNYFGLFPSINLTQKIGETQEFQFSYTRRINRPQLQSLNPFIQIFDPFNYFQGNPDLKPEYTNSLELGFIKYFKTMTINPSIFYSHTKDQISRARELIDSNIALLTFVNYGKTENYGTELVLNAQPEDFLSLNGSVSYYKNVIDATNLDSVYKNSNYTWNGRMTANITLPMFADIGLTYFYSGRNVFAQGVLEPFQSFDVSLKKDFLEKTLTLGLRMSDVFNSLKFDVKLNNTTNFQESFQRKRDTRAIYATLTYRFGTDTKSQDKKRRRPNEQPGNDGFGF